MGENKMMSLIDCITYENMSLGGLIIFHDGSYIFPIIAKNYR
jgi:hypothetical protein